MRVLLFTKLLISLLSHNENEAETMTGIHTTTTYDQLTIQRITTKNEVVLSLNAAQRDNRITQIWGIVLMGAGGLLGIASIIIPPMIRSITPAEQWWSSVGGDVVAAGIFGVGLHKLVSAKIHRPDQEKLDSIMTELDSMNLSELTNKQKNTNSLFHIAQLERFHLITQEIAQKLKILLFKCARAKQHTTHHNDVYSPINNSSQEMQALEGEWHELKQAIFTQVV